MTDKRKKKARAISKKTGTSYAGAINQMRAEKASTPAVESWRLRMAGWKHFGDPEWDAEVATELGELYGPLTTETVGHLDKMLSSKEEETSQLEDFMYYGISKEELERAKELNGVPERQYTNSTLHNTNNPPNTVSTRSGKPWVTPPNSKSYRPLRPVGGEEGTFWCYPLEQYTPNAAYWDMLKLLEGQGCYIAAREMSAITLVSAIRQARNSPGILVRDKNSEFGGLTRFPAPQSLVLYTSDPTSIFSAFARHPKEALTVECILVGADQAPQDIPIIPAWLQKVIDENQYPNVLDQFLDRFSV